MLITGDDVSIARASGSYFFGFRGQVARQWERAALEAYATWQVVKCVYLFRHICPQATSAACSALGLNTPLTRIEVVTPYFGALQAPHGATWDYASHRQGRDYNTAWNILRRFREAAVTLAKRGNTYVMATLAADPNLRAVLNLADDLVSPKFTVDPNSLIVASTSEEQRAMADREDSFPIDTRLNLAPYGGGTHGVGLLDALALAHAATAPGGPPSPVTVSVARTAYEEEPGLDETGKWFRRLCYFEGLKDPDWSPVERDVLEALTDVYFQQWVDAQRAGDTRMSTLNDHRHRAAHVMLAIGTDDRLRFVMPQDGIPAAKYATSFGGDQPARLLLPQLVAEYGL